jgi:predicted nucleotidyltransferase component of viral defense system
MIDKKFLQDYATKEGTSLDNILREYVQHLFLRNFYTKSDSRSFLFKGGTALKLVFGSPRFSEDLDFTGIKNSTHYEEILQDCLLMLSTEGIKVELIESKPTSGGHLAIIKVKLVGGEVEIQNQISFRPRGRVVSESLVVTSNIVPAYNIYMLDRKIVVAEKVKALIDRAKPRDFFDLYFILRDQELRHHLQLNEMQREKIFANLEKQRKEELARELKRLLPRSFWPVVADLPSALKRELG